VQGAQRRRGPKLLGFRIDFGGNSLRGCEQCRHPRVSGGPRVGCDPPGAFAGLDSRLRGNDKGSLAPSTSDHGSSAGARRAQAISHRLVYTTSSWRSLGVFAPWREAPRAAAKGGLTQSARTWGVPSYGNSGQKSGRKIIETTSNTTVSRAPTRA
jgi:hypothetical protein